MKSRTDYSPVNGDTIDTSAVNADVVRWASIVAAGSVQAQSWPPGVSLTTSAARQAWVARTDAQDEYLDPGMYVEHWRCVSATQNGDYHPNGRWTELHALELGSIPGGILQGSFTAHFYSAQFTPTSLNHAYPPCPHRLRVRVSVQGQTRTYMSHGVGLQTVRFPFAFITQAGPATLTIDWTTTPMGSDDPEEHENATMWPLPDAHVGPGHLFVELTCR